MNKLTFDEFRKLSESERIARYAELSDHDRFLVRISDFGSSSGEELPSMSDEEYAKALKELEISFKESSPDK